MNRDQLVALLPLMVLAIAIVVQLLAIAVRRSHRVAALLAGLGLVATLVSLAWAWPVAPQQVTPLLAIDGFSLFFLAFLCAVALLVTVLCYCYFSKLEGQMDELYLLLMLATLGAAVLTASVHAASLFLGLELLSVSLYTMIAYRRTATDCVEAGIKYLILAAAASAFLLFGLALIYVDSGSLLLADIGSLLHTSEANLLVLAGLAMLVTGVGFKLALVPFHLWTPDVYTGAPAPITSFVASVSKAGVVAAVLRVFVASEPVAGKVLWALGLVAVVSMVVGNLLALLQRNVKRLLAYSSIAHLGYLVVAVLAASELALEAAAYYLVAYGVTIVGAFAVVGLLSNGGVENADISDYRGLLWRRPLVAAFFTVVLLSLAGIPLTAGFLGKFYVLAAGADAGLWWLLLAVVINSAVGLFYYLRVVVALFAEAPGEDAVDLAPVPRLGAGTLVVLVVAVLWLGTYPATLVSWIQRFVTVTP